VAAYSDALSQGARDPLPAKDKDMKQLSVLVLLLWGLWSPLPGRAEDTIYAFGARGDGVTDETLALQRAIDAVPPGGTLVIPPGIFLVSPQAVNRVPWKQETATFALRVKSHLRLTGGGTIRMHAGNYTEVGGSPSKFPILFGSGEPDSTPLISFTVDGLTLDGNRAHVTPQPVGFVLPHFASFTVQNSTARDLHIARLGDSRGEYRSTGFTFQANMLLHTYTIGLFYVHDVVMRNNQAWEISEFVDLQAGCDKVRIYRNVIEGYDDTWQKMDAVFEVNASQDVAITDNTIIRGHRAVLVTNKSIPPDAADKVNTISQNIRIHRNTFENIRPGALATTTIGVHVRHGIIPQDHISIKHNILTGTGKKYGIYVDANNVLIASNIIYDIGPSAYSAIYVHGSETVLDKVNITNNRVVHTEASGIVLNNIGNFSVTGNIITAPPLAGNYGIAVRQAMAGDMVRRVHRNKCVAMRVGIFIQGEGVNQRCMVAANVCRQCTTEERLLSFCEPP
jgi:hypothetical protein